MVTAKEYKSKVITVEAIPYDGTEECAESIVKMWPEHTAVGENEDGDFGGLYIVVGRNKFMPVLPNQTVFREVGKTQVCAADEEEFSTYFEAGE